MARSKQRGGGGGGRKARAAEPVVDEVEVVEEEAGMGIDDGIAIITTVLLLVAFLMVDYARGTRYGEGLMFSGKYDAAQDALSSTPAPAASNDDSSDSGE